jgi:hypothetical protein
MMGESSPPPSSPETPPLAPYDPPAPAPQAAAWRRALKVVGYTPPSRAGRVVRTTVTKTTLRTGGRA